MVKLAEPGQFYIQIMIENGDTGEVSIARSVMDRNNLVRFRGSKPRDVLYAKCCELAKQVLDQVVTRAAAKGDLNL